MQNVRALTAVALCWCCFAGAGSAASTASDNLRAAQHAMQLRDYTVARRLLTPLASSGDAAAEYTLYALARTHAGGDADITNAAWSYLAAAAEHGSAQAAFSLSVLLGNGWHLDASDDAQLWRKRATGAGYLRAWSFDPANAQPPPTQTSLMRSAASGRATRLNSAVRGLGVNTHDSLNRTPLHWAAEGGVVSSIETLIALGADVDAADRWGRTPLMLAARHPDSARLLTALLDAGAKMELVDRAGMSALLHALSAGQSTAAQHLIRSGARAEGTTAAGRSIASLASRFSHDGTLRFPSPKASPAPNHAAPWTARLCPGIYCKWPALLVAIDRRDLAAADQLTRAGAPLDAVTPSGDSAVHLAVRQNDTQVLRWLLAKRAPTELANAERHDPMALAARGGGVEQMQLLRDGGYSMSRAAMALHLALAARQLPAARLLVEAGAPLSAVELPDFVIAATRQQRPDLLTEMLRRGANANARDAHGRTALWYAAQQGCIECISALRLGGADPSIADEFEVTPLNVAAQRGNVAAIEPLLARREQAAGTHSARDDAATALRAAAANGQTEFLERLVRGGTKVDAVDRHGQTALMAATRAGRTSSVTALLKLGANRSLRDRDRDTALDIAEGLSLTSVATTLKGG